MGAAKGKAGGCHVSVAQRPASWGSRLGAGLNGGGAGRRQLTWPWNGHHSEIQGLQNWTGPERFSCLTAPYSRQLADSVRVTGKLAKNADTWVPPSEILNQKIWNEINKFWGWKEIVW